MHTVEGKRAKRAVIQFNLKEIPLGTSLMEVVCERHYFHANRMHRNTRSKYIKQCSGVKMIVTIMILFPSRTFKIPHDLN